MFWRYATILCVLSYGALPYCAVLCNKAAPQPACVSRPCEKPTAKAARACCAEGKARGCRGPRTEPPQRAREDSRCGSCQGCPTKQPFGSPPPPPEPRTVPGQTTTVPAIAHGAVIETGDLLVALALGHDPPTHCLTNNDRLAQTAVWLK